MGYGKHERPNEGMTNIWLTPKYIIDDLGPFDLDPCPAPKPRPWATAFHMFEGDGLKADWEGFVFCNPPYGKSVKDWAKKMDSHKNGIFLVFARTETDWFQENISNATYLFSQKKESIFVILMELELRAMQALHQYL